ncbi:MAG: Wzz/FepE/Etk N-terminal domain-containing protein [Clostridiales bacterium]|nr:Wzz/FepE/Etk N-terminal domain-containing protein [Clostridiales bacterium]
MKVERGKRKERVAAILRGRKRLLILLPALAAGICCFCFYQFVAAPVYTSEAQVLVFKMSDNTYLTGNVDPTGTRYLLDDYLDLVTSRTILEQTAAACGLTIEQLNNCSIRATRIPETRVAKISVSSANPKRAETVAAALTEISMEVAIDMWTAENIYILMVEPASAAQDTGPTTLQNVLASALIALLAGVALVLIETAVVLLFARITRKE